MKITDLKGKKVTVMGLGLHGGGVGTISFLAKAGANVLVTDIKTKEELINPLEKLKGLKNVKYVFGQHRSEDFTNADLIIKTPQVSWNNQHIKLALSKNIPVEVDASLFFKFCHNPIIGITGTKGKTTTASLIYDILEEAGKTPIKVGVSQVSVLDKLKKIKKDSIIVFELSSWRLASLGREKLSPQIAVWTNFYPDHLNYYKDMESYKRDKRYILAYQKSTDQAVINWDQETLKSLEPEIKANLTKFSILNELNGQSIYLKENSIFWNDGEEIKKIIDVNEIKIKGRHNLGNVLAACGVALLLGVKKEKIKEVVSNFKGIAHRLELVREIKGVKYYNDTSATTPESAIAGIESFSEPLILIAGGSDKKLDLSNLAETIAKKSKEIIFLKGIATNNIIDKLKKRGLRKNFPIVDSMEQAVILAEELADRGDVVLLSPGAASFGLFKSEFDRGNKFKEAVRNLE
jgi:UDP-N-acetylmuramoylalanine--D-glutamate ligase